MIDETRIATHNEPAWRDRSNHILRLDLAADGLPGHYEQVWCRTDDHEHYELCCIPFFTYGLSLGDVITLTTGEGGYKVDTKRGHRTIRVVMQDQAYARERHEEFHRGLSRIGVAMEFRGHARAYCAIDIAGQDQADAVIGVVQTLAEVGTLIWEWADAAVTA